MSLGAASQQSRLRRRAALPLPIEVRQLSLLEGDLHAFSVPRNRPRLSHSPTSRNNFVNHPFLLPATSLPTRPKTQEGIVRPATSKEVSDLPETPKKPRKPRDRSGLAKDLYHPRMLGGATLFLPSLSQPLPALSCSSSPTIVTPAPYASHRTPMPRSKQKASNEPGEMPSSSGPSRLPHGGSSSPLHTAKDHHGMGKDRGAKEEANASQQSLKLDLDGLDLGGNSSQLVEATSTAMRFSGQNRPSRRDPASDKRTLSSKRSLLNLRARAPVKPTSAVLAEEDTFAMHLRDCEEAADISTLETVLKQIGETSEHSGGRGKDLGTKSEQVLGGFASLGTVEARPRKSTVKRHDSEHTISSLTDPKVSLIKSQYNDDVPTSWEALSTLRCDPSDVLDIPSIDEMGLHSINVGSSHDWEGTMLAAQHREGTPTGNVKAEWAVARSKKMQRKCIVSPIPFNHQSAQRTIIVSDYIATASEASPDIASHGVSSTQRGQKAFSGNAIFELRFLQAGKSAPGHTMHLANPGKQRELVARDFQDGRASGISGNRSSFMENGSLGSSYTSSEHVAEESWPSLRQQNWMIDVSTANQPRRPSALSTLTHTRSASTIIAPTTPVHTESRRPSMGKSMSQDGLEAVPKSIVDAQAAAEANEDGDKDASSNSRSVDATQLKTLGTRWEPSFESYTLGSQDLVRNTSSSSGSAGPSPRTSVMDLTPGSQEKYETELAGFAPISTHSLDEKPEGPNVQARPSPTSPLTFARRASARKDKRLGEWIRRKVMPNSQHTQAQAQGHLQSPPAPFDMALRPSSQRSESSAHTEMRAKPIKIRSKAIKRADIVEVEKSDTSSSAEDRRLSTAPEDDAMPEPIALRVESSQPKPESPGIVAVGPFRRRSSTTAMHMEGSRQTDVSSGARHDEETRRQIAAASSRNVTSATASSEQARAENDSEDVRQVRSTDASFMRLGTSPDANQASKTGGLPPQLIGLDDIPNAAMTMIIPLPIIAGATQWKSPRYLRVSYAPFDGEGEATGAERAAGQPTGPSPSATAAISQGNSSAWFKRLAHALNATPQDRHGESDSSSAESITSRDSDSQPQSSKTGTGKAFRIMAKMLVGDSMMVGSSNIQAIRKLMPPISSFPIVLGIYDGNGRLDLIPEGWQLISLHAGPAPTHADSSPHPLCGVADLIIAGCVACMDL